MIEFFDAFGITWKDRSCNKMADLLENIAIKLDDVTFASLSKVEVKPNPLSLKMFKIGKSLKMIRTF